MGALWVYTAWQLQALHSQATYANPEEGMRHLIAANYSGVDRVEIVHVGKEIFDDLWFVEAQVWTTSRADGNGFSGRPYDNPGCFFLRMQDGWAFVPEGEFPQIIAFCK